MDPDRRVVGITRKRSRAVSRLYLDCGRARGRGVRWLRRVDVLRHSTLPASERPGHNGRTCNRQHRERSDPAAHFDVDRSVESVKSSL
jgi:hypothetical protein